MYDARQIASWFVSRAAQTGKRLSIMELLKLTYISHGWHLEMRKVPLFGNKIEAWKRGPVIPDVYNAFRQQGIQISKPLPEYSTEIPPYDGEFLEQIYALYGHLDAFALSDMTHVRNGPWEKASKRGGNYALMTNEEIQAHYEEKRRAAQ